ncbi:MULTISPECIES: hypothetical protein [Shewanella]|nr:MULTISPECIES: hypothetical protein [Shewanella]
MFSNSIWALATKNKAKADFAGAPLAISVISLSISDDGLIRTD